MKDYILSLQSASLKTAAPPNKRRRSRSIKRKETLKAKILKNSFCHPKKALPVFSCHPKKALPVFSCHPKEGAAVFFCHPKEGAAVFFCHPKKALPVFFCHKKRLVSLARIWWPLRIFFVTRRRRYQFSFVIKKGSCPLHGF